MKLNEIMELDNKYYMNTFGKRCEIAFESGMGISLFDTEGQEYKDFFSGIAVNCLGHSHPEFIFDIKEQVGKLLHTSSIYYIENQAKLAAKIVENSCADRVFFANTGAEANEGALKLTKIYFYKKGEAHKNEIITLKNSFHGRTLATVAATGQEKYQKPYKPLIPGFKHVEINDFEALLENVNDNTAGIMLEVIQGEAGVYPVNEEYVGKVRKLCDEKNIILIFDEIQTGMGRTGNLFGYELYNVEPDIFTLAKALGNGIPISAICAKQFVADGFAPGDHGTTFGGNPLSTAAGLSVFKIYEKEKILDNVKAMGEYFKDKLSQLKNKYPQILEVRGQGLMIGVEFGDGVGGIIQKKMLDKKYLTGCVAGKILRILPPLIVKKEDIDEFIDALGKCIKEI